MFRSLLLFRLNSRTAAPGGGPPGQFRYGRASTRGFTLFSTYYGAHKTARTPNSITDIVFAHGLDIDNRKQARSRYGAKRPK